MALSEAVRVARSEAVRVARSEVRRAWGSLADIFGSTHAHAAL